MDYFTLSTWVALCIFAGSVDAIGQLLCKNAWRPPPYIIVGVLGVMWFLGPVILMAFGPATIGGHTIMTFSQAANLSPWLIVAAIVVGGMFWGDNLTRFDANNKAPFVGYVLVLVEISAMVTAFCIEFALKFYRGDDVLAVDAYQLGGVILALSAAACFYAGKIVDEKKRKKEVRGEEEKKFVPFIPLHWVTLAVITGILSGLGNVLYGKWIGDSMPPYVFAGIIGFVWMTCSVIFMAKRSTWKGMGLRLPVLGFKEAAAYGSVVIGSLLLAGLLTWLANLGRFGATTVAPLVGYTFLVITIAACTTVFFLEAMIKWFKREEIAVSRYEIGGVVLSAGALALFAISATT